MSKVTNLSDVKNIKKVEIVLKDLEKIITLIDASLNCLSIYSKYIPVMEILSVMQSNKTILEIHKNKYLKYIKEKTDE